VRRGFVWSIIILGLAEVLLWLVAGSVQWIFAGFSLGPVYSPQVAEGARLSLTELAWSALNLVVLIAYAERSWGRWLMAPMQLANLVVTIYLGFGAVTRSCGVGGWEVFWFAAIPAISLLLQYLVWRRIDRQPGSSSPLAALRNVTTLGLVVGAMAIGAVLVGNGWQLSLHAIESHTGTVSSATADTSGDLSVTIDSSSHVYYFGNYFYQPVPRLRVGDHVVILTGETCDYGTPLAVQSTRGVWIDSIDGNAVRPYTPHTWQEHETLRWLLLLVGIMIELVALVGLALWIG
jgi:hypothetical protein